MVCQDSDGSSDSVAVGGMAGFLQTGKRERINGEGSYWEPVVTVFCNGFVYAFLPVRDPTLKLVIPAVVA